MMLETEGALLFTLIWIQEETEEEVRYSIKYGYLRTEELAVYSPGKNLGGLRF